MSAVQNAASIPLVVTRFTTAFPGGPAIGPMQEITWATLAQQIGKRREGQKDGDNIVLARFKPEPDGRARRLKQNVQARTAIALDCETDKKTGEIPPSLTEVIGRVTAHGWAAIVYTSHNHSADAPRYRIILPLTAEIAPGLPAVEVVADILGLSGVLDRSKLGASSLFYLPSAEPGRLADHHTASIDGAPIDAGWMEGRAGVMLAAHEMAQAELRREALAAAEARRAAKMAAGFKPNENLIETIRDRLDLEGELCRHGYAKIGTKYLYPGSQTGVPGVHILKGSDGVERVFSHHAADPLAAENLPGWCGAKAIDAVDVVIILDHGCDRKAGLHKMALQFGIESDRPKRANPVEPDWSDIPPPDFEPECAGPEDEPVVKGRPAGPSSDDSGWPEPVDFMANVMSAPILGPQHIPAAIWAFSADVAERMGVDPTAVALAGLVSCASVMTDDWALQPKQHDPTWTENPRIWGAIVGDPSILKTPVINAATRPIDKLDIEARKAHADAVREWKAEEAQAKHDKTITLRPQPKLDRYMVEGSTVEALSEVLRDDAEARMRAPAKKVLSRHDEMSEFFGGLDRYKSGGKGSSERGAYIRLYNGGPHSIDRINRGSFRIPNWSACFLGGVQPSPIQRIARDSTDDGLLQRFMYCVPDHQGRGADKAPDFAAVSRYGALFPVLASLHPAVAVGGDHIKPVVFHREAHQHREDINALAEALSAMPDTSVRLQASFGKWPGLFARLCLTFHLIENADLKALGEPLPVMQVVQENTARHVAAFMREILLPHLVRAERLMFATDQTSHAQWIAGYILSRGVGRITTRDIVRDYRALSAPEAKQEMAAVMASLVTVGWLEPEEVANPAKGVTAWGVNPAVHVQFVERGRAEAERRARAREQIAAVVARARTSKPPVAA